MSDQRTVKAMTDEELRTAGISQEWRSGLSQQDWPYYDSTGSEMDPHSPLARTALTELFLTLGPPPANDTEK